MPYFTIMTKIRYLWGESAWNISFCYMLRLLSTEYPLFIAIVDQSIDMILQDEDEKESLHYG